jgi:dTDP-4-dehydrorhamnose 3,5-epimerase
MNKFNIEKTKLSQVLKITPATIFNDFRGTYLETYNKPLYTENGIAINFIQDDISISKQNVLRGIHGDNKTWKLVSCLSGKFFLVVVNWDSNSSEYQKWISFEMDASNPYQILIPPKFGNGHLITSKEAIFHYKQSTLYDRESQFTIYWNDIKLNIPWPIKNPIISKRDKNEQ